MITSLEANEKGQEYIHGSQLRQEDYNRRLDQARKEVDTKATLVAEKEQELASLQQRLVEWKTNADTSLTTKSRQIEKLETERAKVLTRLNSLRETYAIAEDDLKDLIETPADTTSKKDDRPPAGDYLTMEKFNKEAEAFARIYPKLSAELDDIRDEHRELFNKRLTNAQELLDKAYAAGGKKTIRQIWEEENKVTERRQQLSEEAFNQRVEKEVEARYTKRLSEVSLPGGGNSASRKEHSPVFDIKKTVVKPEGDQTPAPERYNRPQETVMKAVQAHREGKYKDARVV